jgi:hypothetical protein
MVGSAVPGVTDGVGLAVSAALEESDGVGLAVSAVADGERLADCGVFSFGLTDPAWFGCSELGEATLTPVFFENNFPVVWSTALNDLTATGAGLMTTTFRASKPGQALP